MTTFPFPVIQRNPEAQEVFLSPDQVAAQNEADERRHKEELAAQKKAASEAKKKADEEKKQNAKDLEDQKKNFNDTLRTGFLGKIEFAFRNRDRLFDNLTETIKDGLKDRIFGQTIEDKTKENDGMERTTIIERILTNEKYKERPEDLPDDSNDEPMASTPEVPKVSQEEPDVKDDTPAQGPFVNNVIEFPKAFTIDKDVPAEKKQIPVLQKMSKSLDKISSTITKYFKGSEKREKDRLKAESSKTFLENVKSESDFIPKAEVDSKGFSLPFAIGVSGIMSAITGAVLTAVGAVGRAIVMAAPIAAFATGLYLAVKDGIAGWFSAEAWGVNKLSGLVGGLLGGLDEGAWGAIKNGGKWALIGAGIGSVVPVIGTLVGGLLGGAFGAILGWVGGEKIAKFSQGIVDWVTGQWDIFTEKVNGVISWVKDLSNSFSESLDYLSSISIDDLKKAFKDSVDTLYNKAKDYVKNLFSFDYWMGNSETQGDIQEFSRTMEATNPDGTKNQVVIDSQKFDPIEVKVEVTDADKLKQYLDKISSDQVERRTAAIERIYEQQVDNSVVNNSSSNDYSRTNNSVMTNNSNNSARINIMNTPSTRNNEGTAFGTQSLINGGFGSFNRN